MRPNQPGDRLRLAEGYERDEKWQDIHMAKWDVPLPVILATIPSTGTHRTTWRGSQNNNVCLSHANLHSPAGELKSTSGLVV